MSHKPLVIGLVAAVAIFVACGAGMVLINAPDVQAAIGNPAPAWKRDAAKLKFPPAVPADQLTAGTVTERDNDFEKWHECRAVFTHAGDQTVTPEGLLSVELLRWELASVCDIGAGNYPDRAVLSMTTSVGVAGKRVAYSESPSPGFLTGELIILADGARIVPTLVKMNPTCSTYQLGVGDLVAVANAKRVVYRLDLREIVLTVGEQRVVQEFAHRIAPKP